MLAKIAEELLQQFGQADRAMIFLLDHATGQPILRCVKNRQPTDQDSAQLSHTFLRRWFPKHSEARPTKEDGPRFDLPMVGRCIERMVAVLNAEPPSIEVLNPSHSRMPSVKVDCPMCAPLWREGHKPFGAVYVTTEKEFTQKDLKQLVEVARQASIQLWGLLLESKRQATQQ
jgi:GAF domain-containing protein